MCPSHRTPTRRFPRVDARRRELLKPFGSRPFTRADALAAGLSASDLRSDSVTPVLRGVYVAGAEGEVDHAVRCAAACLRVGPDAAVSGLSAAALGGLPVPAPPRPIISVPRRHRPLDGIDLTDRPRATPVVDVCLPAVDSVVAMTHPEALLAECASDLGLDDLVDLADAMLRRAPDPRHLVARWRATPCDLDRYRQAVEWAEHDRVTS